jgi:cytolysin (calcineurin-like family phosphatase)
MNTQEDFAGGTREIAAGSESTGEEQFKGPIGWYIMQAITALEQSLRSDREYFRSDSNSLNSKIDNNASALHTKIENSVAALNNKIDNSVSALNAKIDADISALNAKIDNSVSALNAKIDSGLGSVNARIDKLTYWAIGIVVGTAMTGIGVIVTLVAGALYIANHIR